ncbi:MAG: universal stress protein [Gammaproteobacteria bacterium]|nr:universal stress protein [Gammaproteobacteria bacterium]MCH9744496.1 universal stress protein [Gammaproteobacteria bacterium]
MKKYEHILVALELDPENDTMIIQKAKELAAQYDAKLTLIHAIEHMSNYGVAYGVSAGVDIEHELLNEAGKVLKNVAEKDGIGDAEKVTLVGPAKYVVLEEAKKIKADLIVLGSHGRHGVRLLLGSTANAILHSAECDVLAVRIKD